MQTSNKLKTLNVWGVNHARTGVLFSWRKEKPRWLQIFYGSFKQPYIIVGDTMRLFIELENIGPIGPKEK